MTNLALVKNQTQLTLSETDDVRRGAAFLRELRMKGWPRKFESMQDAVVAKRIRAQIIEAKDYYAQLLAADTPEMLLTRVELLSLRGFQRDMPDAVFEQLQLDWVDDLGMYPADLVELACKRWRRSNNNRAPYACGELMESVKSEFVRRKSVFLNAESVLKIIDDDVYAPIDQKTAELRKKQVAGLAGKLGNQKANIPLSKEQKHENFLRQKQLLAQETGQ